MWIYEIATKAIPFRRLPVSFTDSYLKIVKVVGYVKYDMTYWVYGLSGLFWCQDLQKDIIRAAEAFATIGHKHVEIGDSVMPFFLINTIFIWKCIIVIVCSVYELQKQCCIVAIMSFFFSQ